MTAGGMSLALPSALPASGISSRTRTAAAWLFVLPLLAEGVLPDVVKLEVAGLGLLAFAVTGSNRELPRRALERILATAGVLTLTVIGYLVLGHWPAGAGTVQSYDLHAALWVVTYVAVAVFAVLFYEPALFERVMWRGCTVILWIGVISCAASRLSGHLLLVNPNYGTVRMVGTLSEPSEWAPVLCVVLLLALRRRSRLYVALSLAGLVLADSPTCMLVMALTVPLYFALAGTWKYRALLGVALAVAIPAGVVFVHEADAQAWLASHSTAEVTVGRLLSGIRNIETGGQEGVNTRFASTTVILSAVRDNGWMRSGAGPAADTTYLAAAYPPPGPPVAANALWVECLLNFGEWGVAVLVIAMGTAAWRMRRSPAMAAVLLPFLVATLVNSPAAAAGPVALAVMLYGLGWAGSGDAADCRVAGASRASRASRARRLRPATSSAAPGTDCGRR